MEFRDLKKQYQFLKKDIDKAVEQVMFDGEFIGGKEVRKLEKTLAGYVGVKHCITCGNGTDALILALMAWNIGEGDAIFVPDFTFFASGEAPALLGATPVFIDVDKETFNISSLSLVRAIQKVLEEGKLKPRVIIAVDLFGQPADYVELRKIAAQYNLLILEDGAQGFGGSINGEYACSFGDIATTSFFPAKPLGCYGDGGAVFTDNDEWAEIIRSLCVHGKGQNKYDNVRIGMNSRLDTIQAAILNVKFKNFVEIELEQINKVAVWYTDLLKEHVKVPTVLQDFASSWAQYTIVSRNKEERSQIQEYLKAKDIPSMIYYSKGLHEQPAFVFDAMAVKRYENTDYLKERVLSIPIHPFLEKGQVEEISGYIITICKAVSKNI